MRTIYGILLVSLLLFIASIVFLVMGARNLGRPAAGEPVATVKQIMDGIVTPASNGVYNAVSTVVSKEGTVETAPKNDREWDVVGSYAAALIEASNMLKADGRAKDNGDWMRMSDAMAKAAQQSYQATQKKDVEALLASGEVLNNSCDSCHRNYEVNIE